MKSSRFGQQDTEMINGSLKIQIILDRSENKRDYCSPKVHEERNAKDKPSLLSIFAKMEKLMTQF